MALGSMDFRLNLLANTTGLQQGMNGAKFAVNALVAAMAAVGVGLSVQGIAQAADSYTSLSARINIATKDSGNFNQAMAGVHQVALATNSNLTTTADLFTRLNTVGKDMGMTQQQALELTKTVTQAIKIGGGTAEAADGAVTQFIQAMQGGVLRGEEFNSIMEGGYGLAEALARGLGVTTGELRKMAEAGELSSERVVKALQSQSVSVQATYDKFPTTISNALQRISTSWEILIGQMDQANGASSTVAQWLVILADNIQDLDVVLYDIGEGFVWVGDQLKKIDPATIEALKTALLSAYEALKNIGSVLGSTFEVTFDLLNTALSSVFDFESGVDGLTDKTNGLTKLFQALNVVIGFISDGFSGLKIGISLLAGAVYDVAAAFTYWKSKLLFGEYKDAALKEYEELSQKAQGYYQKASEGALEFKSKGIEALESISKTQKQKDAEAVASSKVKLDQILADQQTETTGKKASEDEKLKAVQTYAEAAIQANKGVMDGVLQADLISKGYMVTLEESGKVVVTSMLEAKKATEDNAKAIELAKKQSIKAEEDYQTFVKSSAAERISLTKQFEEARKTGDLNALKSAQDALAAINTKEEELNIARKSRSAEVASDLKSSADVARKAATALDLDLDILLSRISEKFKAGEVNVVNFSKNLTALGVQGKQAGEVTYQAWVKWLETAKSQTEIDYAKSKLQEFGVQGKLSTEQVAMGMQAIRQVVQKLPGDLNPVEQAFERLGIKTKEQLKLAAQSALADFNTIQSSGQATAESLRQAYERTIQAAIASGDQAVIAHTQAKAASLGLSVQIDDTGKAVVQSYDEMNKAASSHASTVSSGVTSAYREMGAVAREEAQNSIDAWNEALSAKSEAEAKTKEEKSKKSNAVSSTSYTKSYVRDELKKMGYDDAQAESIAQNIFGTALAKDQDVLQKNRSLGGLTDISGMLYQELRKKGLAGYDGSRYIEQTLQKYNDGKAQSTIQSLAPKVYSNNDATKGLINSGSANVSGKSVQYNINFNGKSLSLSGDASQEAMFNDLLKQLETINKSS
ncbi:tape measure protein [Acinetobacter guillouiae]|uniref:tape measure protein n=1 Tax=Acinetobacter guillouiae TaxID=106649 RepID=UPI003AF5989C